MQLTQQIAKHFREIISGGNWTCTNMKDVTNDITWQQATTQIQNFNTIATLVYHTNYYVSAVLKVFAGETLNAKDELSFNHPPIHNQNDWKAMLNRCWQEAEQFANYIEQLPENQLWVYLSEEKYGNYYRNLHGIIEHMHYHLGQIVILKKIIQNQYTPECDFQF
ncbi:MAG: DUF1572 domain-containing protein [bacterium]|nr:DUF1572 domain-containing protein [bacterium]